LGKIDRIKKDVMEKPNLYKRNRQRDIPSRTERGNLTRAGQRAHHSLNSMGETWEKKVDGRSSTGKKRNQCLHEEKKRRREAADTLEEGSLRDLTDDQATRTKNSVQKGGEETRKKSRHR